MTLTARYEPVTLGGCFGKSHCQWHIMDFSTTSTSTPQHHHDPEGPYTWGRRVPGPCAVLPCPFVMVCVFVFCVIGLFLASRIKGKGFRGPSEVIFIERKKPSGQDLNPGRRIRGPGVKLYKPQEPRSKTFRVRERQRLFGVYKIVYTREHAFSGGPRYRDDEGRVPLQLAMGPNSSPRGDQPLSGPRGHRSGRGYRYRVLPRVRQIP